MQTNSAYKVPLVQSKGAVVDKAFTGIRMVTKTL